MLITITFHLDNTGNETSLVYSFLCCPFTIHSPTLQLQWPLKFLSAAQNIQCLIVTLSVKAIFLTAWQTLWSIFNNLLSLIFALTFLCSGQKDLGLCAHSTLLQHLLPLTATLSTFLFRIDSLVRLSRQTLSFGHIRFPHGPFPWDNYKRAVWGVFQRWFD